MAAQNALPPGRAPVRLLSHPHRQRGRGVRLLWPELQCYYDMIGESALLGLAHDCGGRMTGTSFSVRPPLVILSDHTPTLL